MSLAVSINLLLYGLTAPFAAALMDKFGIRNVTTAALSLVALGSGLTVFMTQSFQLLITWGVLIGILTAGSATGQLIFLPLVAALAESVGWRTASLVIADAELAVVPHGVRLTACAGPERCRPSGHSLRR